MLSVASDPRPSRVRRARFRAWTLSVGTVWALGLASCEQPAPQPPGSSSTKAASSEQSEPPTVERLRIVSFSPAMTQMLVDLGLGDRVVGRTPFCDSVPESVPVVGSLLDVDYEKLIAAAPTHIVVQPSSSGTDPEVERLAQSHQWVLIEQGLDRLADVDAFLTAFAANLELASSSSLSELAARCEGQARAIRALTTARPAPTATSLRTLLLVGTDPPTAAGTDTFVSEMLVAAGGVNAITAVGYPELSLEDVVALKPDGICVLREIAPNDAERASLLRPLLGAAKEAAGAARVEVFVSPFVMLPSTRAPEVVAQFQTVLERWQGSAARPSGAPAR